MFRPPPTPNVFSRPAPKPVSLELEERLILTLYSQRHLPEAERAARSLTERAPGHGFGWKALGLILRDQDRAQEALPVMQHAAKLLPRDPEAFNNLGALFEALKRPEHALPCYEHAIKVKPDFLLGLDNLCSLLHRQGKTEELLPLLERKLALRPDDGVVQHEVAMLSGRQTDSAPAAYITDVFDHYAERFDAHLQNDLRYQVPQQLAAWLTEHAATPSGWRVLDLGCGTGLLSEPLEGKCSELVGIDLSGKMLDKARERGGHTRLEQADVLAQMKREADASFDAIVAADVFIYVGKLDEVMREAHRLLAPGGLLAFSVESMEQASPEATEVDLQRGHRLERSGRYSHADARLREQAAEAGFSVVRQQDSTLREEHKLPVSGQLVLWRK